MHAKEIIKNKADKMVDLITDEIGTEGTKKLSASFIDKKTNIKYILRVGIQSGDPESLVEDIDEEDISAKVRDIMERIVALEIREDSDTVYDDTDILARLNNLESKEDYDDTGLKARLTVLESKVDNDTIYDDTELRERVSALEEAIIPSEEINTPSGDDNP